MGPRRATDDGEGAGRPRLRAPEVEEQIEACRALNHRRVAERARIPHHKRAGFLKNEVLVHLIREYRSRGEGTIEGELTQVLVRRCARPVGRKLMGLGSLQAEEAYEEVIGRLFEMILDPEKKDRANRLERYFGLVLKSLAAEAYDSRVRRKTEPLDLTGQGDERHGSDDFRQARDERELSPVDRALMSDALSVLEEPTRTAFVMRHYEGVPIESSDPEQPTVCKYFGVSGRQVRRWLKEAEEVLREWREAR